MNLQFDYSQIQPFLAEHWQESKESSVREAFNMIYDKSGAGHDFLGWVDLPSSTEDSFLDELNEIAATLRAKSEIFVVIGIGGSYLGARAVIEALDDPFAPIKNKQPLVLYAGHNISEDYLSSLLSLLDEKDYSVAVISKSGTTTEPAIAFRVIKEHLEKKYGEEEACKRIVAITDKQRGALKTMADEKAYRSLVVPDDVGGRFSVLTPVGLLPIAIAGYDIKALIYGARRMEQYCKENRNINNNIAAQYAVARQALYESGKTTEILVSYEPYLLFMEEWWKHLYGERHGKNHKGIFPASVNFSTDLHSMGQYIQDGIRNLFETVISVEQPRTKLSIPHAINDLDQLNYIAGKRLSEVNHKAELGTTIAHVDGGVPNMRIQIPIISEEILGELIYFFEMACAVSGYILEVNPFDQPGVEAYKKNMFALLGKKGYEEMSHALTQRLNK